MQMNHIVHVAKDATKLYQTTIDAYASVSSVCQEFVVYQEFRKKINHDDLKIIGTSTVNDQNTMKDNNQPVILNGDRHGLGDRE